MNITIQDSLGNYYDSIHHCEVELFVSRAGLVVTNNPLAYHIPIKAANGELVVMHGKSGVPIEVGKLLLMTLEENEGIDITGYQYIDPTMGLSPDNLKIVPAEESAINVRDDVFLNGDTIKRLWAQRGDINAAGPTIEHLAMITRLDPNEILEGLISGGGYTHVGDFVVSANRFFKTLTPFLSREGIIRLGKPVCYNTEAAKVMFSANTLGMLWEMATDKEKSSLEVYHLIGENGSNVHNSFEIRFQAEGKIHTVYPARRKPPII